MWTSLHHVMKKGRIRFPTEFLRRPSFPLHGISSHYWWYRWRPLPQCPSSTLRANEKPYCVPCRNDGRHHVSSTSSKTARCEGICPSGHQGSKRTRGLQQLDAPETKQTSWGCPNSPFSTVSTMQTRSHNKQCAVIQGQVEPSWQKASLQN